MGGTKKGRRLSCSIVALLLWKSWGGGGGGGGSFPCAPPLDRSLIDLTISMCSYVATHSLASTENLCCMQVKITVLPINNFQGPTPFPLGIWGPKSLGESSKPKN